MKLEQPTPEQIKQARYTAGKTLTQAAEIVHVNLRTWQKWERAERAMSLTAWELFLLKTGQIKLRTA